ncbi:hypothetical protein VTI74DRAFT_4197 [Chaetomium olivicolor]
MNRPQDDAGKALALSDLHTAVISGKAGKVSELLAGENKKELLEARDAHGTTPLMTAVLTGQLKIAKILLRNGASAETKDRRGYKALDYSQTRPFMKKLHAFRQLGFLPVSKKQRRKRDAIAKLLRYSAARESCRRAGKHECSRSVFYKDGRKLNVFNPGMVFIIAKDNLERATVGFIVSAIKTDVKTAAVSGWQANKGRGPHVLDNIKYLQLVQEFAKFLKFKLTGCYRDNNGKLLPHHSGRFVASHAEKKLAVFWLLAALKATFDTTDLRRVHELRDAAIPEGLREAWIFLDHTPCGNCWEFLHRIKRVTGITIYLETRPFLVKGDRNGQAGCPKCPCQGCKRTHAGPNSQGQNPSIQRTAPEDPVPQDPQVEDDSDADTTQPEPEANLELDLDMNQNGVTLQEDEEDNRQLRRPRPALTQQVVQPTKPPSKWKWFTSERTGVYAKPIRRTVNTESLRAVQESSPKQHGWMVSQERTLSSQNIHHALHPAWTSQLRATPSDESHEPSFLCQRPRGSDDTPEPREPVSTISGRSGFFATRIRGSSIEVQLPSMDPNLRAEYERVSVASGAESPSQSSKAPQSAIDEPSEKHEKQGRAVRQAISTLNLGRFAYNNNRGQSRGASSSASAANTSRKRDTGPPRSKENALARRAAKNPTTARAQRGRGRRDEKIRARSVFARVAGQHRRRQECGDA